MWREEGEHQAAQADGRERWYQCYQVRVARVERSYSFGGES
nr:hypothetical protein [Candidatus Reidiella endopervernicosa]